MPPTDIQRVWRKIDKNGPLPAAWSAAREGGPCWLWMGTRTGGGRPGKYGYLGFAGERHLAHRFVYERLVGPIPAGMDLDHLCRVRHCVNPAHLEPVTRGENLLRGNNLNRAKTHCSQGHPYDEANTYNDGRGRRCRICVREGKRRRRAAGAAN